MKNTLFIILILLATAGLTQTAVIVENGMAFLDGKQWLTVTETPINKTTNNVVIRNLFGDIIAQLTFKKNSDGIYFQGEFASVGKKYEIKYVAGTNIQTLLESFDKNKVIVDGKIDVAGLQSYCYIRKTPLMKILSAQEQRKQDDSIKKKIGKKFSFAIYGGSVYSFRDDRSKNLTLNLSDNRAEGYHLVTFPSSHEKGVATGNAGIYFEFRLRKHVFLNLGLNYTRVYYQTKENTNFYLEAHGNASPNTFYSSTTFYQIKENYYITSLPICLYYRLNGKKNYYTFGGGASLTAFRHVIIEASGSQNGAPNETYGETDPIGVMGTLFARIGMFHQLGRNMSVGFESEFKCYLTYDRLSTLGGNLVLKF